MREALLTFADRGRLAGRELRPVRDGEFVIDGLRHRQRTWMGWSTVIYELRIEEDEDGRPCYEIVEETESLGGDTIDRWSDPDDAAGWIEQMIEERHEGT